MATQVFARLPSKVLTQIITLIEEAHCPTLYSLMFIKSTKATAEALLYRKFTLRGIERGNERPKLLSNTIFRRILDPQDSLRSLVREVVIEYWPGSSSPDFGDNPIENLIDNIEELTVFKWGVVHQIPAAILSKLATRFPAVHLYVKNRERSRNYSPIDMDLLLSPQLHSLDLVVLQTNSYGSDRYISEFAAIKLMLQRNQNLKILKLGYYKADSMDIGRRSQRWESEFKIDGVGPLNLQFYKGDTFPTLVELEFIKEQTYYPHDGYDLSLDHCIAWKRAMSWKQLTKIDLGHTQPKDFFLVFRGHIPQLKSLRFFLNLGEEGDDDPAPLLAATTKFLLSFQGLKELFIENHSKSLFESLLPSIMHHSKTLVTLDVNPSVHTETNVARWAAAPLNDLLHALSQLRTLALAIDLSDAHMTWDSQRPETWPNRPFSLLCPFHHLESIQLRIRMPHLSSWAKSMNQTAISKLATDLFREFFQLSKGSRLDLLDLQVQRQENSVLGGGINGVTAKVKRSVRDDAPHPLNGGFEVEIGPGFDGF